MHKSFSNIPGAACLAIVLTTLILSGCALFVSHYDAAAYQYFTSLKAYHIKFIDDYTVGEGKIWNEANVKSACDTGELRFREATEYAIGKKDASRVNAIGYLHNVFKLNCDLSLSKLKKLFGDAYATEQKNEVTKNYDWAISGELSRVGAPTK